MTQSRVWNRNRKTLAMATVCAMAIVCSALLISCGSRTPGGTGSGSGGGAGDPLPGAILLQRDIVVSQDVTVFYTTPASATNIRAFRIRASAAGSQGGVETGDEVEIATGLSPTTAIGETRSFQFLVEDVDAGPYFVGLRYAVSGQEYRVRSEYTITMSGIPVPVFVSPASSRSLYGDQTVEIRVNVGDAQNPVNWRLFYIAEDADDTLPADELGVVIDEGTRNVISQLWSAMGVAPGRYRLGISVTDTGQSVSSAVAAGLTDRILTVYNDPYVITVLSEPPVARPPRIEIIEPAEDVTVGFGVETVTVQYEAEVFEGETSEQRVDFFIDDDDVYDGDEDVLLADRPVDETMATLSTSSLDEGEYYLGAVVYDGVNEPVAGYAEGKIVKEVTPKLDVKEPGVAINRRPNTEVAVAWTTNLPAAAGKVDVYYRRMTDKNGTLSATENRILAPAALSVKTAKFTPTQAGVLAVFVRIVMNDGKVLNKQAPAYVKVTSRPSVFWLGDLASPPGGEATATTPPIPPDAPAAGRFNGAVFEGHNFEDNLGSGFLSAADRETPGKYIGEDFNVDGIDDMLMIARFGKSDFLNPTGIGVGEAYLIRGSSTRFAGTYNVNRTGTAVLPGMVFTGVATPESDTLGIYGVTRMSNVENRVSVDPDEVSELIFQFPRVANGALPGFKSKESKLVNYGHFTLGGLVIVASTDPYVRGRDATSEPAVMTDTLGVRVALEAVGQDFVSKRVGPEPDDGSLCSGESLWTDDLWGSNESETKTLPDDSGSVDEFRVGCAPKRPYGIADADDEWDSIIEPFFGFAPTLAVNFVTWWKRENGTLSFPCDEQLLKCPTCMPAAGVDGYCCQPEQPACDSEWPAADICGALTGGDPSTWSVHKQCGDPFVCAQFDVFTGEPLADSAFSSVTLSGLASCTFVYTPLLFEGQDSPVEDLLEAIALGVPYVGDFVRGLNEFDLLSGLFVDRTAGAERDDEGVVWNKPKKPFGARIIGRNLDSQHTTESEFGVSVSQSGDYLVISAPRRDVIDDEQAFPFDYPDVQDLLDPANAEANLLAGIAYVTDLKDLWTMPLQDGVPGGGASQMPPKPHMYLADGNSHTCDCTIVGTPPSRTGGGGNARIPRSSISRTDLTFTRTGFDSLQGGIRIAGRANDQVRNVLGVLDFNNDTRDDIALAAPEADPYGNGQQDGAVYVVYRRASSLESDYILDKLAYAPTHPERLAGIFIKGRENTGYRFGETIVGGVDFGTNGVSLKSGESPLPELIVSSPYADSDRGEVWIIFPGTTTNPLTTPEGGANIDTLLAQRKVARITGSKAGDLFGFNMANAGDIDGDG
ncbi:MAG: FG-GAP repeat protein, partial [Phycisphaerae bacterium]|nr:FG-GAP repeat protein [Phycisphaerae bacterium]